MKKSLFMLFLACVAGVPSHAQKVSDGKLESRYNITVPHEFLYGNEPVLLLQTGSELRTVNVYDENIDLVKSKNQPRIVKPVANSIRIHLTNKLEFIA